MILTALMIGLLLDRIGLTIARTLGDLRAANRQLRIELRRRTSAEISLSDRETHLRVIAEHTHDLIATLHYDGRILYINPAVVDALGYEPEQAIGTHLFAFIHTEDSATMTRLWGQTIEAGSARGIVRYLHMDGTYRWFDGYFTDVRQENGGFVIAISRDITEQRRLEGQLVQAQKMEGIGRLAGGIAHDFNNLLQIVSGYVGLARSSLPDEHPVQAELGDITSAVERGRALTRQLLTFARQQNLSPQQMDLNRLVETMSHMLTRLIRRNVEIVLELSDELQPIYADPDQIGQVLMNLISNAIDAMPDGGRLQITTMQQLVEPGDELVQLSLRPGPYVVLIVNDTGTGMDEATIRRIFEPFFTTKPPDRGTGLGMAICYGIIHQHGGTILVESGLGKGTTFRVYLPESADLVYAVGDQTDAG
jgi:two-component system, cell cycle sensor histidine kinase and response regulator CckA